MRRLRYVNTANAHPGRTCNVQRMTSACGWMLTLPADATKRMQTEASSQLAMFIVDAVAMFQVHPHPHACGPT